MTEVANTLATAELITVHYACFGGLFGPSPERIRDDLRSGKEMRFDSSLFALPVCLQSPLEFGSDGFDF